MNSHAAIDILTRTRRPEGEAVRAIPSRPAPATEEITLLCPGPVTTSPAVKRALASADISHRDRAFVEVLSRVVSRLRRVAVAHDHDVLVLGGGATAATEAALSTFVGQDERMLVVSNGAFGERIAEMAECLGIAVSHLRYAWGEPISLEQLSGMLDNDPRIKCVAMVHHETSVGRLNPVNEVGRLLAPRHIRYFVDVVSSLGGEEFDMARSRASVIIGSANKCLHGVAGAAFVIARKEICHLLRDFRSLYRALSGGAGTLSEIALALRAGTPVISLNAPEASFAGSEKIFRVATVDEALRVMDRILG